jgi:cytochrome c
MKKVFAILLIAATVSACGGSGKSGGTDSTGGANQTAKAAESNVDTNANKIGTGVTAVSTTDPGAKLMSASDCFTCHKIDTKVIGPAYKDVAAKYPATDANIDTLANKIIKGGTGKWGTTPMTGHPAISQSDAKLMAKYVLSLKK